MATKTNASAKAHKAGRLYNLRILKRDLRRLMKPGEWLYIEKGRPRQGSKAVV